MAGSSAIAFNLSLCFLAQALRVCLTMAALLTLLDYDIRTAENAEVALRVAAEFQPHLILSDIGLPGMDGYQLAPELRRVAGERKLVLAAATGYGLASDRKKA